MTPFEEQLAAAPLRDLPPEWRSRILPPPKRRFAWGVFLRGLLWPHPLAWGAVAACWVAIAVMNFSGPRGPELYAVSPPGSHPTFGDPMNEWCAWQLERRYFMLSKRDEPRVYLYRERL